MTAYYNENDPYPAQWLRNLIAAGHLPPGDVDERSIEDVSPDDLRPYTQCHFFAGIGGWPFAFRLAGWPDDKPVWSGSCPCQPWSQARVWHRGTRGERDSRDLWPAWVRLIRGRRPRVIFGEQVAGRDAEPWLVRTRAHCTEHGYHFHSERFLGSEIGAPQRRPRLYFVTHLGRKRRPGLVAWRSAGEAGPWGWRGQEDLQAIARSPFEPGDRWPQPLIRRMDDGVPARVDIVRAYGNGIIPEAAAQFIQAYQEAA